MNALKKLFNIQFTLD